VTSGPVTEQILTHDHVVQRHTLVQLLGGVPFEVEREVCSVCMAVLSERTLKRVAV
jgi:hypothetical protein